LPTTVGCLFAEDSSSTSLSELSKDVTSNNCSLWIALQYYFNIYIEHAM
jgi:hypothetical protein